MIRFLAIAFLLAHEWYPAACCNENHCRGIPCEQIDSAGAYWEYKGDRIAKDRAQVSPDGKCHVCFGVTHGIICLFLGGIS